jgi:membrane protein implicated in regulation of membrane protease activity
MRPHRLEFALPSLHTPAYNYAMDERTPDDRTAIYELLLFVPASFLTAWFLAGFSIGELWQLVAPVVFSVWFVVSVPAGAWFIRVVVRQINRQDDRRLGRRGP